MRTGTPDVFECRLLTSQPSPGGGGDWHSLVTEAGTVESKTTHLAFTRTRNGNARVYLNGALVAEEDAAGDYSNWNPQSPLVLANEATTDTRGDHYWLGAYRRVAIYRRALTGEVIGMLAETRKGKR